MLRRLIQAHPREYSPYPDDGSRVSLSVQESEANGTSLDRKLASPTVPGSELLLTADRPPASGPVGERASLAEQLRRRGYNVQETGPRFAIEGVLGTGSTACVFAAHDCDLDRPIALKVLNAGAVPSDEAVRYFIDEACITASLDHPNVLPVHEIEMNAQRQIFFSMKRIDGDSLASLIERSTPTAPAAPLADANAITTIFIGVCQALALAHRRGIVHQDIKPDNILIGSFGEVLVCDWGSAMRLDAAAPGRLYGSPLYMSPEQARSEGVDRRSDVYCIGASLFHTLTLRPPTWHDESERFWEAKRSGSFQAPTIQERRAIPAPLLAIACKALAAQPGDRYVDAAALLLDLRAYQAGLAVAAAPESVRRRLSRWHRRHWRMLWSWSLLSAIVLSLTAMLWGERVEEFARWGAPKVTLTVASPAWRMAWKTVHGSFAATDHGVISTGDDDSLLIYDHSLGGAVAIDYVAEIMPGSSPCDISAVWARDVTRSANTKDITGLSDPYYFKVGAFDNAYSTIASGSTSLASVPFHPQVGHRYHIRDEIIDNRLTMSVDGKLLCEWIEPFPFTHGYVGLEAYYPGKYFESVTVYQRQSPSKVPVTAIADASVVAGEWSLAASQYAQIAEDHPDSAIGDDACYKQGLCSWHQQAWDDAQADWQRLPASYADRIQLNRIERAIDIGDVDDAMRRLESLSQAHDQQVRDRDTLLWNRLAINVCGGTRAQQEGVYALYLRCFTNFPAAESSACNILLSLNRPQEILDRFPGQHFHCCMALQSLNRLDEIIDRYPEQRAMRDVAAFRTGRWDALTPNPHSYLWQDSLWLRGEPQRVLALPQADIHPREHSMMILGHLQEIIADPNADPEILGRALSMCGRAQEALARCPGSASITPLLMLQRFDAAEAEAHAVGDWTMVNEVQIERALTALLAGRTETAQPLLTTDQLATRVDLRGCNSDEAFLIPWLDDCAGFTTGALDRACAALAHTTDSQQQLAAAAQVLIGSQNLTAFLHQPCNWNAPARSLLCVAILAQRRHDGSAEMNAETAWLKIPAWQKDVDGCSSPDLIVRWRLQQLGVIAAPEASPTLPNHKSDTGAGNQLRP